MDAAKFVMVFCVLCIHPCTAGFEGPQCHPNTGCYGKNDVTLLISNFRALAVRLRWSRAVHVDLQNDLTFLRVRSNKHEIMVAPGEGLDDSGVLIR